MARTGEGLWGGGGRSTATFEAASALSCRADKRQAKEEEENADEDDVSEGWERYTKGKRGVMVSERRVLRVHPARRQQLPNELDRVALDLVGVDLRAEEGSQRQRSREHLVFDWQDVR